MEDTFEYSASIEISQSCLNEAIEIINCGLQNTPIPPFVRVYIENWLKKWSMLDGEDDENFEDDTRNWDKW